MPPRVSVAIPLHDEEAVLPELLQRLGAVLDALPGGPHEMVLVDDGSRDRTREILVAAVARDPRIVVVALSRNFGHQPAITAALDHVSGDVVVVMDGDLQDTPETIPALLARHAEGHDVVYALRAQRKEGVVLRACYWLFYRLLARMSDVRLPPDSGDFALLSRRVVQELRRMPEHHRYLRGLRSWAGFRQVGVVVERAGRQGGESKYSALGLLQLASDGIFAFSIVPLRAAAVLGLLAIGLSTAFAAYALWARIFMDRSPAGFTASLLVTTFLFGVNLVFLGVIGEYVGRIFEEVKRRPLYVVDEVIRSGAGPAGPSG